MFKFASINQYNAAGSNTELDILKRFALEEDSKEEELFNIGALANLACKLQADFFFYTKPYAVNFVKEEPFTPISISDLTSLITTSLGINYPDSIQPYLNFSLSVDRRVLNIFLTFSWSASELYENNFKNSIRSAKSTPNICTRKSKFKGVFEVDYLNNTFNLVKVNTRQLEKYLWSRGFVAVPRSGTGISVKFSKKDIQVLEELCEVYLQKCRSMCTNSNISGVWVHHFIQSLRYICANCRWPGYSAFAKKARDIVKRY
jgi:hypothetical protein